jgi:hypothetical protein
VDPTVCPEFALSHLFRFAEPLLYGTRVLELAKGKNSIDVGTVADLLPVLATVKKCVEAGELDSQIDAASAAVRERFTR